MTNQETTRALDTVLFFAVFEETLTHITYSFKRSATSCGLLKALILPILEITGLASVHISIFLYLQCLLADAFLQLHLATHPFPIVLYVDTHRPPVYQHPRCDHHWRSPSDVLLQWNLEGHWPPSDDETGPGSAWSIFKRLRRGYGEGMREGNRRLEDLFRETWLGRFGFVQKSLINPDQPSCPSGF